MNTRLSIFLLPCLAVPAVAQTPQVIYSEVALSSTSTVPGALDAAGLPVATTWLAIEDLAVRQNGAQWCVKGRTVQATTNDSLLLLGSGLTGTMFVQDGQPVQGGIAGEQYDFFDTPNPISWDSAGNLGLSFRAKGGVTGTLEKVTKVIGGVHTIVLQQGTTLTGLVDIPANPTGDEQLGNSVGSVQLRDDGTIFYGVTPITNCSPFRYPALLTSTAAFRQSGVSTIGAETWDSFVYDGCGSTADGLHWFARGDTENTNTAIDNVFVVDDVVVFQEGSPIVAGGPVMTSVFFARILPNGTWFARGDDPAANDWAVRDGALLAKTGDLIAGTEHWGNAFSAFHGNSNGRWVLAGNTDEPNTTLDSVLVLDGTTVLLRESDPVALDNDGLFDDDAFITSFQPNEPAGRLVLHRRRARRERDDAVPLREHGQRGQWLRELRQRERRQPGGDGHHEPGHDGARGLEHAGRRVVHLPPGRHARRHDVRRRRPLRGRHARPFAHARKRGRCLRVPRLHRHDHALRARRRDAGFGRDAALPDVLPQLGGDLLPAGDVQRDERVAAHLVSAA
ncbi:MAG: hypothetical protein IPJ77_17955 [Planctomycetes bacterium]|nr:hypothetical protein [Planctomycetota bacterium]